jgi:hypothetical protein
MFARTIEGGLRFSGSLGASGLVSRPSRWALKRAFIQADTGKDCIDQCDVTAGALVAARTNSQFFANQIETRTAHGNDL